MPRRLTRSLATLCISLAAASLCIESVFAGGPTPQSGGFSYQFVLRQNGQAYNGTADFEFRLYDGPHGTGATQIGPTLPDTQTIADGTSNTLLLFEQPPPAPPVFNGEERWLEVRVRTPAGSANPFVALTPWQNITTAPYAAYALNAALPANYSNVVAFSNAGNTFSGDGSGLTNLSAANLTGTIGSPMLGGTYANAVTLNNADNSFSGSFNGTHSGSGAALTNLNATNIASGTLANARTTGTAVNTPNTLVLRDASGNFTAGTINGIHAGSGASLTGLNASNIASGTLDESRLPSSLLDRIPALTGSTTLAGSIALPGTGNSLVASNGFIYLNTLQPAEFHVFDLSNPASPAHRASVPAISGNDLVVVGNSAYLVGNGILGVQILNISNPDSPTVAGAFPTSSTPIGIDVVGSLAYVVSLDLDVLEIFNISNPASVTLVGSVPIAGNPVSVRVSGNHAYVALDQGNALQVVNVSNPASPSLLGNVPTGAGPRMLAHQGNLVYVACNDADLLQILNVSNPNSPSLVGSVPTDEGPSDVRVAGGLAYVTNFNGDSVQVFDVSNAASPSLLQTIDTNVEPRRVSVLNGYAYVSTATSKGLLTLAPDGVSFANGSPISGSGLGLTSLNASSIATGVIANTFTSGTSSNTSDTLVLRDATGRFNATGVEMGFGSAAAPSYAFEVDSNTGMFRPLTDTIGMSTNGVERLRITSSGNVGIGTTTPDNTLHVHRGSAGTVTAQSLSPLVVENSTHCYIQLFAPDVSTSGIVFGRPTSPAGGSIEYLSSDAMRFSVDAAERMRIDGTGSVGIGTSFPTANLHIRGAGSLGSLLITPTTSDTISQVALAENSTNTFGMIMRMDGAANELNFLAVNSGVEAAPVLSITRSSTPAIGIGTTSPLTPLHVQEGSAGTISPHSNTSMVLERSSSNYLQMFAPDANESGLLFGGDTLDIRGGVMFNSGVSEGLAFRTGGNSTRMAITSTGNVGIGTTAPTFQLQLSTNSAAKPTSSSWTISSDRRLKKNIEPIHGALDQLLRVQGVRYQWINPASQGGMAGTYTGLIAQDVEQVFPEWIATGPDGYKTLTVIGFEGLTIEALRDLREEKDAEIAVLHDRIDQLESLIGQLLQHRR